METGAVNPENLILIKDEMRHCWNLSKSWRNGILNRLLVDFSGVK